MANILFGIIEAILKLPILPEFCVVCACLAILTFALKMIEGAIG